LLQIQFYSYGLIETLFPIKQEIPVPGPKLRYRVHGNIDRNDFLKVGQKCFNDIQFAIESVNCHFDKFTSILDWGCGCGRVIRYLLQKDIKAQIFGCDIDRDLINWCGKNIRNAKFDIVNSTPPLSYELGQFDFIYGISVLTHLDEKMQMAWLKELNRIMKPGAILLLTVHGRKDHKLLIPEKNKILNEKGFLFEITNPGKYKLDGLPDFYQTSYHTYEYILKTWSKYFSILNFIEQGMNNHQDVICLGNKERV
jgi:SAM-dependent methyltransferase